MTEHHRCHALNCNATCPPRHLMCTRHWAMVPRAMQRDVYNSVGLRGPDCDESWAPWWRASHRAIAYVGELERKDWDATRWLNKHLAIADEMERRGDG